MPKEIHITFDGHPDRAGGRFVQVHDENGKSIDSGAWQRRGGDYWELVIPVGGAGDLLTMPDWVRRQMGIHVVVDTKVLTDLLELVQPVVDLHTHCVTIREELKEILRKPDVDAGRVALDDLVLGIKAAKRVVRLKE